MNNWRKLNDDKINLFKEIKILKEEIVNEKLSFKEYLKLKKIIDQKLFAYKVMCARIKEINRRKN